MAKEQHIGSIIDSRCIRGIGRIIRQYINAKLNDGD